MNRLRITLTSNRPFGQSSRRFGKVELIDASGVVLGELPCSGMHIDAPTVLEPVKVSIITPLFDLVQESVQ